MTWGTPVQSFVFLGLLIFELEPMYATSDRQTDRQTTDADHRLIISHVSCISELNIPNIWHAAKMTDDGVLTVCAGLS